MCVLLKETDSTHGWMDRLIETLWVLNLPCCYDTVSQTNKPPRCAFSKMEFSGKHYFPQMQMDFSAPKSSFACSREHWLCKRRFIL